MAKRNDTQLTPRQIEVVSLVRAGLSNSEVAGNLGISEDGVKAHLSRLYLRFGVNNRVALLAAIDNGGQRAKLRGATLGELRAIAGHEHERSQLMLDGRSGAWTGDHVSVAREALAAVDVALDLLRDMPPETAGSMLDALRKRVAAAVATLDAIPPQSAATGSARAL